MKILSAWRDQPIDQVGQYLIYLPSRWIWDQSGVLVSSDALQPATKHLSHKDPLLHQHGSQPTADRLPHLVASYDMQGGAWDLFCHPGSPREPAWRWRCMSLPYWYIHVTIHDNHNIKVYIDEDWLIVVLKILN